MFIFVQIFLIFLSERMAYFVEILPSDQLDKITVIATK